jgi:hypothetical protein
LRDPRVRQCLGCTETGLHKQQKVHSAVPRRLQTMSSSSITLRECGTHVSGLADRRAVGKCIPTKSLMREKRKSRHRRQLCTMGHTAGSRLSIDSMSSLDSRESFLQGVRVRSSCPRCTCLKMAASVGPQKGTCRKAHPLIIKIQEVLICLHVCCFQTL